jgi:hypothetical protein
VTSASCHHKAVVTGGKHPSDLPQFRWINTLLGNFKTSFSGTFHTFNFDKYAGATSAATASASTVTARSLG